MLKLNLNEETNWKELVALLLSGQQDEIILKDADTQLKWCLKTSQLQ